MNPTKSTNWMSFIRAVIFSLAALPAIYTFIAIQYSAITVPFWDHTELIQIIASWYDGTFKLSDLWAPHNHTRPLVYRFVMLFNAVLTDWDIRSEYVYIYIALYGTFACHIWALRHLTAEASCNIVFPAGLLIISLIVFSPVGHNNHWWSMMFQLNATNLFIAFGLLMSFSRPQHWSSHISAAVSCWLASFTLTNGIFAILTVGLVFQLTSRKLFRPSRWSFFWGCNLLVLLAMYLPGITLSSNSVHPNVLQLVQFSLAYLGAPLSGLLWFPFQNMFDIPIPIMTNVVCGTLLLVSCTILCWNARTRLYEKHTATLILFGFSIFAIVSAIVTGWGRAAFDEYGVANGNSSRYTIFGAYLLLGQVYYLLACFPQDSWKNRRLNYFTVISVIIFVLLSMLTYCRAVKVYADVHNFNKKLTSAYPWGHQPIVTDKFIHPNPESVLRLKRDLQRLELSIYSQRQVKSQKQSTGEFIKAGLLSENRQISQRFTATEDGLKAITITLVTPNGNRTAGIIDWQVTEIGQAQPIAHSTLNATHVKDWEGVRLKLPYISNSKGREYQISITSSVDDTQGAGVALYQSLNEDNVSIITEAKVMKMESVSMGLRIDYTK